MRVHIYFKNEDELNVTTSRVTVTTGSDVRPRSQKYPNERTVILGTLPGIEEYSLKEVESFWIEED